MFTRINIETHVWNAIFSSILFTYFKNLFLLQSGNIPRAKVSEKCRIRFFKFKSSFSRESASNNASVCTYLISHWNSIFSKTQPLVEEILFHIFTFTFARRITISRLFAPISSRISLTQARLTSFQTRFSRRRSVTRETLCSTFSSFIGSTVKFCSSPAT